MKRRAPHDELLKYIPDEHREAVKAKLDADYAERQVFEDKKAVAARIDAATPSTESTDRLARHNRDKAFESRRRPQRESRESRRSKKRRLFKERGRKLRKRMEKHIDRYAARLRELGQDDAAPIPVPPHVWRAGQLIMADPSGRCARVALAALPPAIARRARKGALSPEPYHPKREREGRQLKTPTHDKLHGSPRYWKEPGVRRWDHPAAIRTICAVVVLFKLARRTRSRSGFKRVVRGIPRKMLCKLLADPFSGAAPCINTLFGNKDDTPGDVVALAQAKVFHINQPPGSKVEPCDKGPSGFAFNNYWFYPWLPKMGPPTTPEDEELAELAASGLRLELGVEAGPDPPD